MEKHTDFLPEQNWKKEFGRLGDVTYLDHAGAALYSNSQMDAICEDLKTHQYGNPHSRHSSSSLTMQLIQDARSRVLQHLGMSEDSYEVIFTSGATGSLKLLAESFPWSDGMLVYTEVNHTSVLGIRETALQQGARVFCLKSATFSKTIKTSCVRRRTGFGLFIFPAMCNFSGAKYPWNWVSEVQNGELEDYLTPNNDISITDSIKSWPKKWYCAVDAATLAATCDMPPFKPDLLILSFYKIFGYPTGLGALIVRKDLAPFLTKPYFGGGTVLAVVGAGEFRVPASQIIQRMEDGTPAFLDIISLRHGLNTLASLAGSMSSISSKTFALARFTHHSLSSYRHANGMRVAQLYTNSNFESVDEQGGIVAFNLLKETGDFVGFTEVEKVAALYEIELRTGCFCNPGACQHFLKLGPDSIKHHLKEGHVCGDEKDLIDGKPTGAVRVSFGYPSRLRDVQKLLLMVRECFISGPLKVEVDSTWSDDWDLSKLQQNYVIPVTMDVVRETLAGSLSNKLFETSSHNGLPVGESTSQELNSGSYQLQAIYLYPIKSCAPMKVNSWSISRQGLLYDRSWMIVTSAGVCLTQKKQSKMCLIKPWVDLDGERLLLRADGFSVISIPLASHGSKPWHSRVCGHAVSGFDCGDEVSNWLSAVLGTSNLRLLRQSDKLTSQKTSFLSLANRGQYLLVSLPSIRALQEKINEGGTESMTEQELTLRFRPNFVVEGGTAYDEEKVWTTISVGSITFQVKEACSRCHMVSVNQETGGRTKEPLLSLLRLQGTNITFGVLLSSEIEGEATTIKSGSAVFYENSRE